MEKNDIINILEGLKNKISDKTYKTILDKSIKFIDDKSDENLISMHLEEILNSVYDGIYITDGEGKTIFVNDSYSKITGIPKNKVIGNFVSDMEGKLFKGSITNAILKNKRPLNNTAVSLINGKYLLISGKPIFNTDGSIKYVVINNRDISDLINLEKNYSNLHYKNLLVSFELDYIKNLESDDILNNYSLTNEEFTKVLDVLSKNDYPVLIQGEVGTGKFSASKYIHKNSTRKNNSFISVNCDENLSEHKLLGSKKRSNFSESSNDDIGLLEVANKGTLVFQNVENLTIDMQDLIANLITEDSLEYDIKYIFISNDDLQKLVNEELFLPNLYDLINLLTLNIKPLRKRKHIIPSLVNKYLSNFNRKYDKNLTIPEQYMHIFTDYFWPGNDKELYNIIERLALVSSDSISYNNLRNIIPISGYEEDLDYSIDLRSVVEDYERYTIIKFINKYGNINQAAKYLGISQSALWKKCKKLNIEY